MTALTWDAMEDRTYETGTDHGVLFVQAAGVYGAGVAWSGITGVTESPSGAEATALYADNIKYLSMTSAEEFGGTIEAYTYPDEFEVCDGSAEIVPGVKIGQQERSTFAFSWRTKKGNAAEGDAFGYLIHIAYGAKAAPSERAYKTVNDSPEALTFSWTFTTTPVMVDGFKPTAILTVDSTKVEATKLAAFEAKLYGGATASALPLPDDVVELIGSAV